MNILPRIFISSSMAELPAEREAIKAAVEAIGYEPWLYEHAGASPRPGRAYYQEAIAASALYLGIFGSRLGKYTREEYEFAVSLGKPVLIYQKKDHPNLFRTPELDRFLSRMNNLRHGHAVFWFRDAHHLSEQVAKDIRSWENEQEYLSARKSRLGKLAAATAEELPHLQNVSNVVREDWVNKVLNKVKAESGLMTIRYDQEKEASLQPWDHVRPGDIPEREAPIPHVEILDAYETAPGALAIIGAPGSGKSMSLLMLIRSLLPQNEKEIHHLHIPVFLPLVTWTEHYASLDRWILAEMKNLYRVPYKISSQWLKEGRIILCLDGLDELDRPLRAACTQQINQFKSTFLPFRVVVTSRKDEYLGIRSPLNSCDVIALQPFNQEEIWAYLDEQYGTYDALKEDLKRDSELLELATSAIWLDVMRATYADAPGTSIQSFAHFSPEKDRKEILLSEFEARMFSRIPQEQRRYSQQDVRNWFSWLSRKLSQKGKSIFQAEELQPDWLAPGPKRRLYSISSRSVGGLVLGSILGLLLIFVTGQVDALSIFAGIFIGLILGLIAGIIAGLLDMRLLAHETRPKLWGKKPGFLKSLGLSVSYLLLICVAFFVFIRVFNQGPDAILILAPGFIFGAFFGIDAHRRTAQTDIKTLEKFEWKLKPALIRGWLGICLGAISGLIFGLAAVFGLQIGEHQWGQFSVIFASFTITGGFTGFLLGGFRPTTTDKLEFNQGIKWTIKHAAFIGGSLALPIAALVAIPFGWIKGFQVGVFLGMLIAVWKGSSVIKHYLLRWILHRQGQFPLRAEVLLEYGSRLIFLQKIGGGYKFKHPYIQEYFAQKEPVAVEEGSFDA